MKPSIPNPGRPPQSPPRPARGGFTLIEAVLALAILSISVFALAETTARCLAVIRLSRNYQTARAVLEKGEAMYPVSSTNAPEDLAAGPEEIIEGFYFQRFEPQPLDEEARLFAVRTRVSWSEAGQNSFEEVASLFYSAAETEP